MSDLLDIFGPPELCTLRYGAGICRFQTTSPQFARKLSQRKGAALVGRSLNKGYLRIFQEVIEPWRARLLVTRYLKTTNGVFSDKAQRPYNRKPVSRVTRARTSTPTHLDELTIETHPVFPSEFRRQDQSLQPNSFLIVKGRVVPG